jgi:hypothetical protein
MAVTLHSRLFVWIRPRSPTVAFVSPSTDVIDGHPSFVETNARCPNCRAVERTRPLDQDMDLNYE